MVWHEVKYNPSLTYRKPISFYGHWDFMCDGLAKHNLNVGIESSSVSTWTDQSSSFIWQEQSPAHLLLYYIGKQISSSPAKEDFI